MPKSLTSKPLVEPHVADAFKMQGFMTHIGASLIRASNGKAVVQAPFCKEVTQHHGQFHGGFTATLADTAAGFAALSLLPSTHSIVTVEFKINFLTRASAKLLRATGEVLRAGQTLITVRAFVEAITDRNVTTTAEMVGTMFALQPKP